MSIEEVLNSDVVVSKKKMKARSLEGKMEARKRDRERKRRDQLSTDQLDCVRSKDKKYKQLKRQNMSETDKQKAREVRNQKNRSESKKRTNLDNLKEIKRIDEVVRKRRSRSLLSEEEKGIEKLKAKVAMAKGRKNGFIRSYKQRQKRDKNDLYIWKRFIKWVNLDLFKERNPRLKDINDKLQSLQRQIKDFENNRRLLAHQRSRMKAWKGRPQMDKEKICNKRSIEIRKHRKIIDVKVDIEDSNLRKSTYESDSSIDNDQEENIDYYYD